MMKKLNAQTKLLVLLISKGYQLFKMKLTTQQYLNSTPLLPYSRRNSDRALIVFAMVAICILPNVNVCVCVCVEGK